MADDPAWLQVAEGYLGTKEVVGKGSNPVILKWARKAGGWISQFFRDDDTPWCALFVNACLQEAGLLGTGSLAARSFEGYGFGLEHGMPGAILVFSRPGGGGHVGFYVGETATRFRVRGGNQGNHVSDAWIDKARLLAIRWPELAANKFMRMGQQGIGRVMLSDDGTLASSNEA